MGGWFVGPSSVYVRVCVCLCGFFCFVFVLLRKAIIAEAAAQDRLYCSMAAWAKNKKGTPPWLGEFVQCSGVTSPRTCVSLLSAGGSISYIPLLEYRERWGGIVFSRGVGVGGGGRGGALLGCAL